MAALFLHSPKFSSQNYNGVTDRGSEHTLGPRLQDWSYLLFISCELFSVIVAFADIFLTVFLCPQS